MKPNTTPSAPPKMQARSGTFFRNCLLIGLMAGSAIAQTVPDLTNGGVPNHTSYINLGPTGLTGWVYREKDPKALLTDLNHTGSSRQIQVTAVAAGSPAVPAGILANDVILGASGDGSTPVDFTSDARKSLALAIAAAEARTTSELKLKVWRAGVTATHTLTLQNLGAYGANAPVSDAKCALIVENARQALLATSNSSGFGFGTLALMALDDPNHPNHAAMKAQIDAEITAMLPDAATLAMMNSGIPETADNRVGWHRGHKLIVLAEYYLIYGEHPNGGVFQAIQAHVNSITTGQSIFGTFGHIYAYFRWPDDANTPMMGGYGAINSSAVPGLYGLLLAKQCNASNPKLDECINRALAFYGSYAGRGCIPYGEHEPGNNEFSSNGKSGAAALLFDLAPGKQAESKYFAKMAAAGVLEYESGHSGCYFNNIWSPLGAAHGGDDAIKNYFAENSWLYDLARKWDGSFAYNVIYYSNQYTGFNSSVPCILTYALPMKRLHMTGRGRSAEGVLDATQRTQAVISGLYDETTRTKAELIADLGDWSAVVHTRAVNALAAMSLTSTDLDTLHALASDPQGSSREGALMVLEKVANLTSAPVLSAILADPDPHIRRLAAKALLLNPAKAGELNTVLAATGAAKRPVFPMDSRDPLQHDLYAMGQLLFSTDTDSTKRGILCVYPNIVLTGVDRQLLYPAVRAVASCASGVGRSTLGGLLAALTEADAKELGDVLVDTAYYRSPADPMFADSARSAAMDAMVRFTLAEAISVAERSIRADFTINANRGLYGEFFQDLQTFGGTNLLVTPDPDILQLCMDYIREHTNFSPTNAAQAELLMEVIQADRSPAAPIYLKSFNWVASDAATLTLPANQTQLHASVTDHAKGELTYTWRKVHGAGNVTFSFNGTAASKDTTVTFDNTPGHYLFEVAVVDARGLSEIKKTVAMTLYDTNGTLPSNQPPAATPQSITVAPGTPTNITLTGSDPESAPLVFTVTQPPYYGSLSGTAPDLTYVPDLSYHNGADSFTFEVTDSFGQTSSATVSITVDSSLLVTHVHEPFDYPVGALVAGNAGGIGMTGTWQDGPVTGKAWIYDETTVATPVNTGVGTYSWNGVVDNLPTHVETGAKMVGLSATHGGDSFEIHRPLAQTAGVMAGADKVLWASVAYHRAADSFAQNLGLALTTDCLTNGGRSLDTSGTHGSGAGDGIGVARPFDISKSYCAVVFDGGSAVASTTAPTFGTGDFVMVLKFEFGATDKVSAYAFREYETINEASFDQRAVVATAAIDENILNRLTVTASRGDPSYDEIRIGDTLAAVVGLGESTEDVTPPNPDPISFAVAPTASASSISMTATTATDSSGVEYYFTCTSGGGKDSGWQDSTSYTDLSLGAGTYSYTVQARDKSVNWNLTGSSTPSSATITSATPGQIAWNVFNISGNVSDVSAVGTLVSAHGGADLGTVDVVDGSTFVINGVTFDDGFVFDTPSHKDGLGSRGGTYPAPNAAYGTLMSIADRQGTGNATFTFNNLTIGNTYQIQLWHGDNVSTALQNGLVVNTGGTATTPAPAAPGHATLVREIAEGGYGQYAIGTFVAGASTQQFLARAYGSLTTTPVLQSNTTINGCQLRLIATGTVSTPPTLAASDIVDDQGGAPVPVGTVVAYDVTFSKAMNGATINYADFSNAGTASGTIGTVAALSLSTYRVSFHALSTGTVQLRVNAGAVITDLTGNPLNTAAAILDDTIISVVSSNLAPVWSANPVNEVSAAEDAAYNSTLADNAVDADNDTLVFAKVSGPAWLSVAANGALSGTPSNSDVGANVFTISVSDGIATAVQATLNITVDEMPVATPAIVYWDGGTGTWGDLAKWATVSGATTPDPTVAPSVLDTAIFNTISGGTTVQDVALDGDRAVNSLIFRSGTPNIVGNTTGTTARTLTLGSAGITVNNTVAANFEIGRSASTLGAVNIALGANQTWTNNDNNILTVNGVISGNAQLTLAGVGHFRINGANSFTGGLIINGGTVLPTLAQVESFLGSATNAQVTVNAPGRLGLNRNTITGTMTLNGGTLDSTNSFASTWNGSTVLQSTSTMQGASGVGSLIISSVISGSGGLTKGAAGSLTLTNANTFTGDTISGVNTSSLFNLNHTLALQNSTLNTTSSSIGAASGGLQTNVTALILGGLSGNKGLKSLFRTDVTAGGYNNLAALTLNTGTGKTPAYSGGIINGAANMTLTKTGQGTQTLSGINTYTGATTVSQGTLALVGGSQTSPITVAFGASLGFTLDSPTTSTSSVNFGAGTVAIIGTPTLASYTLMTADGGFTGTPVLSAPVPGYELIVQGTQLKLLIPQSAPVWSSNPITEINAAEDAAYSATLADDASDADSDPLTFAKISGPAWLSVAPDGMFSGTPTQSDVGANAFTVSVSDGAAPAVEASLNITVVNTNDVPVFATNPIIGSNATEDSLYAATLAGSATDSDSDPLAYAKVSGPAWLSVAPNGTLSGTPIQSDVGASVFTISVSDGITPAVEATLNIAVINVNDAPVFAANPINGADATEDALYAATLAGAATDGDGDLITYAKVSGPEWLSVAPNGALTGTPTQSDVGANSFTVSASDSTAPAVSATLNITVVNANNAPVFLTNPIIAAGASEETAYTGVTLAAQATDPDAGDTITYSKVSGPAWLVVASSGPLSGTPPAGSAGLNTFVVRATDSASATVDATLEITVTGLPLPWVATDIGTGMLAGSTTFTAGTFTQAGSGVIGSTSDRLRYTYQTLTGDGEITARITNLQNTGSSSRVGVMIRDSLAANSKEIFMGMTSSNAYRWVRRTATGGATTSSNSNTGTVPNTWVRLVRSGTTITAYKSTNGTTWTTVGSTTNTTFASTCYIGIAVGSGTTTTLNSSQFSNVSVTP